METTKTNTNNPIVTCFGEVLWDVLPEGPQPGGAPLNVAYHLNKLGLSSGMISRIGNDAIGTRLKDLIDGWKIDTSHFQVDPLYPTSEVIATVTDNEVTYEILQPVAWDFIGTISTEALSTSKFLVYGSLASRSKTTRDTLLGLLESDVTKVFDINLRSPFIDSELLEILLSKANIVKFNQAELEMVQALFGGSMGNEASQIQFIMSRFGASEVIVTKGGSGASYYTRSGAYHTDGFEVTVNDTIGSGDSFLAAFIVNHYLRRPPEIILKNAAAMGAFIATQKGGCPDYDIEAYNQFKNKQYKTQL